MRTGEVLDALGPGRYAPDMDMTMREIRRSAMAVGTALLLAEGTSAGVTGDCEALAEQGEVSIDVTEIDRAIGCDLENTRINLFYKDSVSRDDALKLAEIDTHVVLHVEDVCNAACARLAAPLADTVWLHEGALIVLDEDAFEPGPRFEILLSRETDDGMRTLRIGNPQDHRRKSREARDRYLEEAEALLHLRGSVSHLTYRSLQLDRLHAASGPRCRSIGTLAVVLTGNYMGKNGINARRVGAAPGRDATVARYREIDPDAALIWSYEQEPFFDPDEPDATRNVCGQG